MAGPASLEVLARLRRPRKAHAPGKQGRISLPSQARSCTSFPDSTLTLTSQVHRFLPRPLDPIPLRRKGKLAHGLLPGQPYRIELLLAQIGGDCRIGRKRHQEAPLGADHVPSLMIKLYELSAEIGFHRQVSAAGLLRCLAKGRLLHRLSVLHVAFGQANLA